MILEGLTARTPEIYTSTWPVSMTVPTNTFDCYLSFQTALTGNPTSIILILILIIIMVMGRRGTKGGQAKRQVRASAWKNDQPSSSNAQSKPEPPDAGAPPPRPSPFASEAAFDPNKWCSCGRVNFSVMSPPQWAEHFRVCSDWKFRSYGIGQSADPYWYNDRIGQTVPTLRSN